MPVRSYLVTLLLLLHCSGALHAQVSHYNFSKVDIENGLSHNQVFSIFKDSIGFVWFGTASGLNRFDGYNVKSFVNIPIDSTSLEDNYVSEIFQMPENKLWIGCKSTVCIYDQYTEKFDRNYTKLLEGLSLPRKRLLHSLKDKNNNYWFLFEKEGLFKYSLLTQKTERVKTETFYPKYRITNFVEDPSGRIWIVFSDGHLVQMNAQTAKPLLQSSLLQDNFGKANFDFRVVADRQNNLWVYTSGEPNGVFKIELGQSAVKRFFSKSQTYRLNNDLVRGITQDRRGTMWIGTDHGGINLIDELDNTKVTFLTNKENDKNSLGYNSIESIYQDSNGIIWAGTGKKGVSYFNQNIVQFETLRNESGNGKSLPYNDVNYFVEDKKGNVWIGTNGGGLIYFNRVDKSFRQYLNDPYNTNSLSSNVIVSLCLDREDKLWIGTYMGGLDVFDGKDFKHYKHNPADPASLPDNNIWHLIEDHKGVIWIGTLQNGLCSFDKASEKFVRYATKNDVPKFVHTNYIPVIKEDREGNLWIGTLEGLEVLNKSRTAFSYYKHDNSDASLSHEHIIDITEDKRGLMWIGTRAGLNVFDKKTKKFKRFTTDDGLPDNTILTITEDKKGNLWITTPKGLCNLVVANKAGDISFEVRNFNENNNVQGKFFNESASMVSRDGLIFVGGSTGFNIIDPSKVVASGSKPQLVFTSIDIFNNEVNVGQAINKNIVLTKSLPFASEIQLSHNENIFSIEFATLDFSGNNQYAYKLEGFNKNWMYTNSKNRKVTYTNLDPGVYYFKVKTTNSDGVWSDEEKTIRLVINPPFWKTPWAFVLYALIIGTVLYLARRYTLEKAKMRFEVAQQRRERERVEALDAVKTKFFTNVSHEFRTPLSLILTPLDRIVKNSADPEQKKQVLLVQRNAKRLLNLVNQLLDFRKMEVQEFKLQTTEGDIIKFIKELCYSFSDVSEMKNINLSFNSNTASLVTYFDSDKLEKIIFNLLSNAFKYTPSKGSVEIDVVYTAKNETEAEEIKIVVKDSGIGIPADKQEKIFERFFQNEVPANITNPGTGIGLAITKEFVKLHNGSISVSSEQDKGTEFTVVLPIHQSGAQSAPTEETHEIIAAAVEIEEVRKNGKGNKPLILLVEDNDDFRFYLKDNLQQQYNVVESVDGQEAWDILKDITPDLIVSDVMMPHMDGIELAKRVKKSTTLNIVPIVLLTAVGDEEMQLESYRLGVSDYMTKPFTYEILESRIKNILSQAKQATRKPQKLVEVNPAEIEIPPAEEKFLKQVLEVVEKNIANPDFTVEELSKELFMHRAGMYRKLLSLTGLTPIEFIRSIRLKRGKQLLEKSGMTVSEIAYEVGFNNPKKFSQHFKEEFGITPSQFQKEAVKLA